MELKSTNVIRLQLSRLLSWYNISTACAKFNFSPVGEQS
nr:MAG TPA: hypothetical protein [Caudoviricetes sp.]